MQGSNSVCICVCICNEIITFWTEIKKVIYYWDGWDGLDSWDTVDGLDGRDKFPNKCIAQKKTLSLRLNQK